MAKMGKRFCFTLNNWHQKDIDAMKKLDVSYMVVGIEVGEKGTPHLQGYVRFKKVHKFNAVKKMIGARAHIENARGILLLSGPKFAMITTWGVLKTFISLLYLVEKQTPFFMLSITS